ncbi:acetyl-CoA synthetase-like protein [Penicillium concentricum]|uniref:Acetyl-CoA synthetase-like protein n=1 Tax=Penicillium concentricum TaxID=293559 RepID=A0A9W9S9D6_9EURO|nr:acetyl-CoA synthetase-like protein [Penicillium concentricum]KAJ5374491.1 acetyl-CoA synthetase-like protein [Penicillium concentricum]
MPSYRQAPHKFEGNEADLLADEALQRPDFTKKRSSALGQYLVAPFLATTSHGVVFGGPLTPVNPEQPGSERTEPVLTGALVRYNSDGTFVYVGRQDTQIKIRGQRLELAEANHRQMEIPEVKPCR